MNNKAIAPMVFNGSCNTQLFEAWVAQFLIKELKPGQVVIMDNASFHKSQRTRDSITTSFQLVVIENCLLAEGVQPLSIITLLMD